MPGSALVLAPPSVKLRNAARGGDWRRLDDAGCGRACGGSPLRGIEIGSKLWRSDKPLTVRNTNGLAVAAADLLYVLKSE